MWYGLYDESRNTTRISLLFSAFRLRPLCNSSLLSYHSTVIYTFHSCFSATMNCRRRRRSFFPIKQSARVRFFLLPSFFCRLKKYEGTSLWVRERKSSKEHERSNFSIYGSSRVHTIGKFIKAASEKGGQKKRDNIEAESLAEWWKMRESWTEKVCRSFFLALSISFICILCMPHQTLSLLLLIHASEIQILCQYVAYECDILWWIYLMEFRPGGAYQEHIHIVERNFRNS